MGILDEAIREHLELKRQRGATESELKRLEDEAFGPPSRPGEPDFPEHGEGLPEQAGNGAATDAAPAPSIEGGPDEETTVYEPPAEAGPGVDEPDLDLERAEAADAGEETHEHDEEEPGAAVPPEGPIEALDTVEHPFPEEEAQEGPEGEPEAPEESEGEGEEDVLADTPEFLKDAPEDDELWFEQGEPKDFDF